MFRNHDVIRYQISGSTWCRHGLAVVYVYDDQDGRGTWAKDTYWGIGDSGDSGLLLPEEIESGVVIGNIDEFKPNQYLEHEDFADEDKFYVPSGGCSAQHWIRIGAVPRSELTYARLKAKLWNAESDARIAANNIEYRKRLIAEHLAKFPESAQAEKEAVGG